MAIKRISIAVGDNAGKNEHDVIPMFFDEPSGSRLFYRIRWICSFWTDTSCANLGAAIESAKTLYRQQQKLKLKPIKAFNEMSRQEQGNEIVQTIQAMESDQMVSLQARLNGVFNKRLQYAVAGIMDMYELNKSERSFVGYLLSKRYLDEHESSHKSIEEKHQAFLLLEGGPIGTESGHNCRHVANKIMALRDTGNYPTHDGVALKSSKKKAAKKKVAKKKSKK